MTKAALKFIWVSWPRFKSCSQPFVFNLVMTKELILLTNNNFIINALIIVVYKYTDKKKQTLCLLEIKPIYIYI